MVRSQSLIIPLVSLIILYSASILFFHFVEGWGFIDAAYFTTSTISTVGYGDFVPTTDVGKIGSIFLTFLGISLAFYIFTQLGALREQKFDPHIKRRLQTLRHLADLQTGPVGKVELKRLKRKIGGKNSSTK